MHRKSTYIELTQSDNFCASNDLASVATFDMQFSKPFCLHGDYIIRFIDTPSAIFLE